MSAFDDIKERVREALDFIEYIRQDGVELHHQGGSSYRGESPFTTPSAAGHSKSLSVDSVHKLWIDFRDTEEFKGDCFAWVMKRDGVGFRQALIKLAAFAGVPVEGISDEEVERHERQLRRYELFGRVADYFCSRMPDEVLEKVLHQHYHLRDPFIKEQKIGFDDGTLHEAFPDDYDLLVETGLVQSRHGGLVRVDYFLHRLVFPYWVNGKVVYFIGREMASYFGEDPGKAAKYTKLPNSQIIENEFFYGEDAARGAEVVLVTEGVTDAAAALQAGLACVSPVTVRFRRQDHPKLIELCRRAKKVVICNDAEDNRAGEKGAIDTARALHEAGIDVRLATLPRPDGVAKVDVNSFLATNPPEALQKVIDAAKPYFDFLLSSVPKQTPPEELDAKLQPIFEAIAAADGMRADKYAQVVADLYGVKKKTINQKIKAARAALQKKNRPTGSSSAPQEKPQIQVNDRQLARVFADARKAIVEINAKRIDDFKNSLAGASAGIPQQPPGCVTASPCPNESSEDDREDFRGENPLG